MAQQGFNSHFGARPLQRTIEAQVVTPLAIYLNNQSIRNVRLKLDLDEYGLVEIADQSRVTGSLRGQVGQFSWCFGLGAKQATNEFEDATGSHGGGSRWPLPRTQQIDLKMPPACTVEFHVHGYYSRRQVSLEIRLYDGISCRLLGLFLTNDVSTKA